MAAPAGAINRVAGVALPFVVAVAALAANALTQNRSGWLSALLYMAAALAVLYGMLLALSVPLRLTAEGTCQPAPVPCPLGFDHPMTAGETVGVYAAMISGALSLLISFVAAEVQYRRRPK
ncbi:MAG: hypothetical protein ACREOM_06505 [Candidatus Dormibacteraceae bacterium]